MMTSFLNNEQFNIRSFEVEEFELQSKIMMVLVNRRNSVNERGLRVGHNVRENERVRR